MSRALTPVKVVTIACGLAFLTVMVWVLRGYVWPTLSNVEVATLQALLDPTLFHGDFAVQEGLRFTPRFYYNELILLPARLGLPLAWAFVGWHLVALAALLGGLRALARTLGMGEAASAVFVVWLLTVSVGTLGGTYFYTHAPVPAVWAAAVVAWGAACAARSHWVAAYACFGAAALLQFLVGFYAGVLALPALLHSSRKQQMGALMLWALGLALVYGPMRWQGNTDAGVLDNAAFVEIYARLRLPHHLVPSTWGWPAWVQAAAFYGGAWWFLRKTSSEGPRFARTLFHATLGLAVGALALNYVFVELYPLALVAKLQPARITPLAQGIVFALLALRIQSCLGRRDWLRATLLALIPLSLFPGFLLMLAAILTPPAGASKAPWQTLVLTFAVLLAFQPFDSSIAIRGVHYGLWAAIFFLLLVPQWLAGRPWALASAAVLAVAGAAACARASLRPDWPPQLARRFAIDARPYGGPAVLGQRFATSSPVDAVVLLPPSSEAWSFKLYARRAGVVDDKNAPFTDRGLCEWKRRMDEVLGEPLAHGTDPDAAWQGRAPDDLCALARRYGARYVLTRDDWHAEFPGKKIDQEQGWSLWQLP